MIAETHSEIASNMVSFLAQTIAYHSTTRSASIKHYAAAMAIARGKFPPVGMDRTAHATATQTYQYADLSSCLAAVVPALSAGTFDISQPFAVDFAAKSVTVTTEIIHGESGEWRRMDTPMPVPDVTNAKSIGAAVSYARRYGLLAILCIQPGREDAEEELPAPPAARDSYDRPSVTPDPERRRELQAREAAAPGPAPDEDPMQDAQWLRFCSEIAKLTGSDIAMMPAQFLVGWQKRVDGCENKAELNALAKYIAVAGDAKGAYALKVAAEMKTAFNRRTKELRNAGGAA